MYGRPSYSKSCSRTLTTCSMPFHSRSQLRAGNGAPGIAPARGLGLELVGQGVELAPGPIGQTAEVQLLNAIARGGPRGSACPGPVAPCRTARATCPGARASTSSSTPRSGPGSYRSSPNLSPLPCGRMHASVGREVQSILLRTCCDRSSTSRRRRRVRPAARICATSLRRSSAAHQIGRQRIAARKAVVESVGSFAGALIHRGAVDLLLDDSGLSDQFAPSRSIQPRTVRGSLSSSRAMSSIDCPSPCRRTALACRLR